jgi:hypothetical protein
MRAQHILKTLPLFMEALISGDKTFEIRPNDRDFQVGDFLYLREWYPHNQTWGDRQLQFRITYVLADPNFGVMPGYAVLGITRL